jgi:cytoskeletal protein CcmA (bactofilin family)
VGAGGKVEGEIRAHDVRIRGLMNGAIIATGKVEITLRSHCCGADPSPRLYSR